MEAEELDVQLDELENRLDRLRALYEQYFLGIEKIEPAVARKDVDRRFWLMRRTQIRNTARRFRLQVLVQRYNTFQQYWARICREIENGTFKRHLVKAEKKFGTEPLTWAAKKRRGRHAVSEDDATPEEPPEAHREVLESGLGLRGGGEISRDARGGSHPDATETPHVPAPAKPAAPKFANLGRLDLDLDDLDLDAPAPKPAPKAAAAQEPPAARKPAPAPEPPANAPQRVAQPAAPAPGAAPAPPPVPAGAPAIPKPAAAAPPAMPLPRPGAAPGARPPLPVPKAPGAPAPGAPPVPARPKLPLPGAASAGGGAGAPSGVSDGRVKQLHAELTELRRQMNQPDTVSFDALAKSLRETEQKLRAQHQGRSIDFQISVRDGKPVVKPVVRK